MCSSPRRWLPGRCARRSRRRSMVRAPTTHTRRHYNALETNLTGSRRLSRTMTLFFGYDTRWSADIFPERADDLLSAGADRYGYAGYGTAASQTSTCNTCKDRTLRCGSPTVRPNDFPQVNFFAGRPPNEVRADLRLPPSRRTSASASAARTISAGTARAGCPAGISRCSNDRCAAALAAAAELSRRSACVHAGGAGDFRRRRAAHVAAGLVRGRCAGARNPVNARR